MQIFFSIGASWGAIITMASYNKFNKNCYIDARIFPLLNSGTSIFIGFVIFSIIGFMAHSTGRAVSEVVTHGPGLVFVVYPSAVVNMPLAPVWSVLFFLMLFMIGLDSQFGMMETVISAFIDENPDFFCTSGRKMLLRGVLCFIEFLLGIPCVMQGGVYVLQIMDWYSSVFSIMILSFCECFVIGWIYGAERFYRDISLMIGFKPCIWWKILWCFITPALVISIFIFTVVMLQPVTYGSYSYPAWAIGIGWVLALCSLVPIPVNAIVKVIQGHGMILGRIHRLLQPSSAYGPARPDDRQRYLQSLQEYRPRIGLSYDPSLSWEWSKDSVTALKHEYRELQTM